MDKYNNYKPAPEEKKEPKRKRLTLSRTNKMIAGVCGGIAEYFSIDSSLVRILFIALMIITAIFPMVVLYIACWAIMPLGEEF